MSPRAKIAFLLLVLVQAAHSIEEYVFRLYDVFAPARFASGLVSDDLGLGFAILNTGFFVAGIWVYFARVRPNHPSAPAFVCVWIVIEIANGIAHTVIALNRGEYFPGVATAPMLTALALYLALRLSRDPKTS
jgi:hypothetical protein